MTKRLESKFHVCKKLDKNYNNIWGLPKGESLRSVRKGSEKKKKKKVSVYGKLLKTKQSFRYFYCNMQEKTFKRTTLDRFVSFLESRLDVVLFRSCFTPSLHQARQLINHGGVSVNGKIVRNPSTQLSQMDLIELQKNLLEVKVDFNSTLKNVNINFSSRFLPPHLEIDYKTLSIVFLWDPDYKNTYYPIKADYEIIQRFYK
jgi:small subunit ribosomal protein S4